MVRIRFPPAVVSQANFRITPLARPELVERRCKWGVGLATGLAVVGDRLTMMTSPAFHHVPADPRSGRIHLICDVRGSDASLRTSVAKKSRLLQ